ncbi:GAF and ANTAR domain-containing protein [Paenarthrobacter sp. NPDC056912]|uniref:GAF and ANTAR domain-containing protein n=1 Tax=Paenarthrobacter sp. NPDC056912 TaxID=3345965 RepID=UPI00367298EE
MTGRQHLTRTGSVNHRSHPGARDNAEFVAQLQDLLVESADIPDFLPELVTATASRFSAMGSPVACGATVISNKKLLAAASSSPLAKKLDDIQYRYGDGPGLAAARTRATIHVPDVHTERRWPDYVRAAEATKARSILALPLDLGPSADGVMTLYSTHDHAYFDRDILAARQVTGVASKALQLALKMAQLRDTRDDMAAALESRTTIDTAVGMIMAQNRCSRDEAFQILVKASNHRNIKLRTVAAGVIAGVAGDHRIRTSFDD